MEGLTGGENIRRSQPRGRIDVEKLDINVATEQELQKAKYEHEHEGIPLRHALECLGYYEHRLIFHALRRNRQARLFASQVCLGYDDRLDYELRQRQHSIYFSFKRQDHEKKLAEHLGKHWGWDEARIGWLFAEMDKDVTDDFVRALRTVLEGEAARKLIPNLEISTMEEAQAAIDNFLDDEAKDRVDHALDDLYHLERLENPRFIRDFCRLVELVSISSQAAASEELQRA